MFSLRTRLLISYLLLLVITLSVFTVTFLVAISTQPAPPQATYQQLAGLVRGLNLRDLIQDFNTENPPPRSGIRILEFAELLDQFAQTREVRVLLVSLRRDAPSVVLHDSSRLLPSDARLVLRMENYRVSNIGQNLLAQFEYLFGAFNDSDSTEWLFSGIHMDIAGQSAILVATERPTQSLQGALASFNTALTAPLVRASLIGLIVAIILAIAIARTIARPLQAASAAATAVARGDLEQQIPVTGPPEVRAVAQAFNHMSAEVRTTQKAQHDFMANVTHDLKTPLTSIQGYSQAIIDGTVKQPAHAAEIIYDEASRLARMVIDLTDLTRIQAGQFPLHMTHVDIGQIAGTVTDKLAVVAQGKGITLHKDIPALPVVSGDGDKLVQVFQNLIGNAIKYTPEGGVITVCAAPRSGGVEVAVKDNGMGIPQDELPRIFERFYQVDKARGPSRGTGLGLAIAYEIVQAHRGTLTVQSVEGQGAVFRVWLPVAANPY